MINYAIYAESGQVLSSGTTTEEVLEAGLVQVPQGCNLAVTDITIVPGLHRHDRGSFLTIPPPPGAHCEFDYASAQWIDPRSLQDFKDAQWEQVKLQRNNTEFSVFKFQGVYYDCDRMSQSRIQGAVQLASIALANNQTVVQEWTTADNSVVSLNATDLLNLGLQLGLFVNKVHDYGRVLRARIDAADSSLDVQEVLWDEAEFNATLQ